MIVIKRNKRAQRFNINKIKSTLMKTFKSTGTDLSEELMKSILDRLVIVDGFKTNEIQTQLEDILMKMDLTDQARYLIIFRHLNHHEKSLSSRFECFH